MADTTSSANSPASEPDLSGRQIGDYLLLRRLGRGGMAEVYLAEQQSLSRKVAFKVLRASLAHDVQYVRRFQNEARAAAALVHANIVQVHEVGQRDGIYYIVQEYVSGQNLRQLLTRSGALDVPLALNIMRQVSAALQKAAQHAIVHRDIKPENIMLAVTGEVKVADFGLARVGGDESLNLTQVGVTMGTPLYMSPEQVEGRGVDPRSDLYSFGVTCYQMLAGRTPFEGDSPLNVAVQHLKTEPTRLEQLRSDLPDGLCRIVHKLLAKKPDDRYQQAADLLRELRGLQIEGVDQAWPTGGDEWTTAELLALQTARIGATQQLDTLMKLESQQRVRRAAWRRWMAGVALAFSLGGAAAWATRPSPLLDTAGRGGATIEKKASVQEQYFLALTLGSEAALRSVGEYFPPAESPVHERYARLAQQRLAEMFMDRDDLESAYRTYGQMLQGDATDPMIQATGLIGQANVLLRRDDRTAATAKLSEAVGIARGLPTESRMAIQQLADPKLRLELERLLREFNLRGPGDASSERNRPSRTSGS